MSSLVTDGKRITSATAIHLGELSLVIPTSTQAGLQSIAKRIIDLVVSSIGVLLLSPLFLFIALAIFLETGWPIFFSQTRLGEGGKKFSVYKFRSMLKDAEARFHEVKAKNQIMDGPIFKLKNDPRMTRVGRFLRRTSLDELPQLLNVMKGEMSLVGPRPPLESEVINYSEWHLRRLSVKPGMTGLWQVSGRSNLSFTEMVQLDVQYVERWSLALDLAILARTPTAVLFVRGAF